MAVVVAAGESRRMASRGDKPFLPLGGKPLLLHCLETLTRAPSISHCVLVCRSGQLETVRRQILDLMPDSDKIWLVPGGAMRSDSVWEGLQALPGNPAYVLIHDGARPLITVEFVETLLAEARIRKAVVPGLAVKATLKQVDENGRVLATLERSSLREIQTPQVFECSLILDCHRAAQEKGFKPTDDAALVEAAGHPVYVVKGDPFNLKVTSPEDLPVAERYLAELQKRS
ncbi:MAG: 2-C-methyl-D-erythritol 4-phosphate cytidylyltransferase [Candidatus Omnitrophica bacterium]|nr:2-C-methyl-D-erythritol 4-phosphate cytidylyltransferase [Candidatus Omnitrophota bacterium]